MPKKSNQIPAGQFKTHCLQLINEVSRRRISLVITKHGKPLATLVPFSKEAPTVFGCLKDSMIINTDIVTGTGEEWDADQS